MPDLPARPSLDQLRHQAKDLLHAARRGDRDAAARISAVSDQPTLSSATSSWGCHVPCQERGPSPGR